MNTTRLPQRIRFVLIALLCAAAGCDLFDFAGATDGETISDFTNDHSAFPPTIEAYVSNGTTLVQAFEGGGGLILETVLNTQGKRITVQSVDFSTLTMEGELGSVTSGTQLRFFATEADSPRKTWITFQRTYATKPTDDTTVEVVQMKVQSQNPATEYTAFFASPGTEAWSVLGSPGYQPKDGDCEEASYRSFDKWDDCLTSHMEGHFLGALDSLTQFSNILIEGVEKLQQANDQTLEKIEEIKAQIQVFVDTSQDALDAFVEASESKFVFDQNNSLEFAFGEVYLQEPDEDTHQYELPFQNRVGPTITDARVAIHGTGTFQILDASGLIDPQGNPLFVAIDSDEFGNPLYEEITQGNIIQDYILSNSNSGDSSGPSCNPDSLQVQNPSCYEDDGGSSNQGNGDAESQRICCNNLFSINENLYGVSSCPSSIPDWAECQEYRCCGWQHPDCASLDAYTPVWNCDPL